MILTINSINRLGFVIKIQRDESYLVECDAVPSGKISLPFRSNVVPPSSAKQATTSKQPSAISLPAARLAYSWAPNITELLPD
jgi:hypothetical protein